MTADELASPAMLALLAAVILSCLLTARGGRSVWVGLALFIALAAANWTIALNVSEFGEFGLGMVLMAGLAVLILTPISWQAGSYLRERRASAAVRRCRIGE